MPFLAYLCSHLISWFLLRFLTFVLIYLSVHTLMEKDIQCMLGLVAARAMCLLQSKVLLYMREL